MLEMDVARKASQHEFGCRARLLGEPTAKVDIARSHRKSMPSNYKQSCAAAVQQQVAAAVVAAAAAAERQRLISKEIPKLQSDIEGKSKSNSNSTETNKSKLGHELAALPDSVREWIAAKAEQSNCESVHICDGSESEKRWLIQLMVDNNQLTKLAKYDNCWLARTDPRDVARVESRTLVATTNKHDVLARGRDPSGLANWMSLDELDEKLRPLLANCMSGRTMFVVPFSMGPIGGRLSKLGVQLTDSAYVALSMQVMTRVSRKVFELIGDAPGYVRCLHSVGCPLPLRRPLVNNWPCYPEATIISHVPERNEIVSFGSGYGGNSLLGKKCFALRLGSIMGRNEGWLAEHMLILALTSRDGAKKYVAAAFPSACGKTNLAMLRPTLPGYKVECVGDDIAWMRFDSSGQLRAINPEFGFFGVAPGTNGQSNPNAMKTIERNTIFTNVAETSDGAVYWEGLQLGHSDNHAEQDCNAKPRQVQVTDWLGQAWQPDCGRPAAHPNSRFCCPASQCPIIDEHWQSADGVPISAIIFGGRRPSGVPLVFEARDWTHGVYVGAAMRSEATAAAEHKSKQIMHDPFAMRPFFGYNFGHYLAHWLSLDSKARQMPKIFHVNWFRKDANSGHFLWPGFGDNIRVLDWILRRLVDNDQQCAVETPIGLVPRADSLDLSGLGKIDMSQLLEVDTEFWLDEQRQVHEYLDSKLGPDLPDEIRRQSELLRERLLAKRHQEPSRPQT